jgi:hypothetical protein
MLGRIDGGIGLNHALQFLALLVLDRTWRGGGACAESDTMRVVAPETLAAFRSTPSRAAFARAAPATAGRSSTWSTISSQFNHITGLFADGEYAFQSNAVSDYSEANGELIGSPGAPEYGHPLRVSRALAVEKPHLQSSDSSAVFRFQQHHD